MYDVFMISYDETNADTSFRFLKTAIPLARHVSGIAGIHNAHMRCAELSKTKHFFVVDSDNEIIDDTVFYYRVPDHDSNYTHLWYAQNPVNGLRYGWGAVKLFNKNIFLQSNMNSIDMTTQFSLKIIPEVKSITHYNASPLETWRSAFRECVKLTIAPETADTLERLAGWLTGNGLYADYSIKGAKEGISFAKENISDASVLTNINNYEWLSARFFSC